MPPRRGQAQRPAQAEEPASTSRAEVNVSTELGPPSPPRLIYDVSRLSPPTVSRVRASETAGRGRFKVHHCGVFNHGAPNEYIAVQLLERESTSFAIRFGTHASDYSSPRCHCKGAQPCPHMYWLFDQIANQTMSELRTGQPVPLSRDGYPEGAPDIYYQVRSYGIEVLALELGWNLTIEKAQQYSEVVGEPEGRIEQRIDQVREIMAALSPHTASVYHANVFSDQDLKTLREDDLAVLGNLEATFVRILVYDDTIFQRVRALVSPDVCAQDFFRKMGKKAHDAIRFMDQFREPNHDSGFDHAEQVLDVRQCARVLTDIVEDIAKHLHSAQFSPETRSEAAHNLIDILTEIVEHYEDMYYQPVWEGTPQRAAPMSDHSLYQNLIRSPPLENNKYFIIDHLEKLTEVLGDEIDRLQAIHDTIRMRVCPASYLRKISNLIARLRSASVAREARAGSRSDVRHGSSPGSGGGSNQGPESTTGSKRRGAAGTDRRSSKRMK